MKIKYKKLSPEDLPLLFKWYHLPHVRKWYSKKRLSYTQFENKYLDYISNRRGIYPFLCYCDGEPVGYLQYYVAKLHPWDDHGLEDKIDDSAGLDLFIGEKKALGKGLGKEMIMRFLKRHLFRYFSYCLIDPEIGNDRAIKCYQSCGFQTLKKLVCDHQKKILLMIKKKKKI